MANPSDDAHYTPPDKLSEIDKRILRLVAQGRSSKEIGKALNRSPLTIDSRLKEVCTRLGAGNRVQAASMLLLSEAAPPPRFGGTPKPGLDPPVIVPPGVREDEGRRFISAPVTPEHADRKNRRVADDIRSLFHGNGAGTERPGHRLARLARAILLITVALALIAFFLASALAAFQEVFLGIRT